MGSRRLKEPVLDQTRKINRRVDSQWQNGPGSKVKGLYFLSRQTSVCQLPRPPSHTHTHYFSDYFSFVRKEKGTNVLKVLVKMTHLHLAVGQGYRMVFGWQTIKKKIQQQDIVLEKCGETLL